MFKKELLHQGPVFKKQYEYRKISSEFDPIQEEGIILFLQFLKTKPIPLDSQSIHKNSLIFKNFLQSVNIKKQPQDIFLDSNLMSNFQKAAESYKKNDQFLKMKDGQSKCIIDGQEYSISNLQIPFGIFTGRGDNPHTGKLRKEIQPRDVTINSTIQIDVPSQFPDQNWLQWISDPKSLYLASWKDDVTNKITYMRPERSSNVIQSNSREKFELARKLHQIRDKVFKKIQENDEIYLCVFLITEFGIRIGSHDLQNGVMGVTQLCVKNVKIEENSQGIMYITLNFKGKDSVMFNQTHECDNLKAFNILKNLMENKGKNDRIFSVNNQYINDFLNNLMPGLSAKVFRTYKSSYILFQELQKIQKQNTMDSSDVALQKLKISVYKVAYFCNHVKTVKNKDTSVKRDKMLKQIEDLREKLKKTTDDEKKQKINDKIKSLYLKLNYLTDSTELSVGTSLQNYIDPRIVMQYCMDYKIDYSKIYSKNMLKLMQWAEEEIHEISKKGVKFVYDDFKRNPSDDFRRNPSDDLKEYNVRVQH